LPKKLKNKELSKLKKEEYDEIVKKKLMDRHKINLMRSPFVIHSKCLFPVLALSGMVRRILNPLHQ
jgi:hypothetical protein